MPFIPEEARKKIDPHVDALAEQILTDGEANYAVTRLFLHLWNDQPRYAVMNTIIGVLECCKLEFYRQFAGPYEDEKRRENGKVTLLPGLTSRQRYPERPYLEAAPRKEAQRP